MVEITLRLNASANPDPVALEQLLIWANKLHVPLVSAGVLHAFGTGSQEPVIEAPVEDGEADAGETATGDQQAEPQQQGTRRRQGRPRKNAVPTEPEVPAGVVPPGVTAPQPVVAPQPTPAIPQPSAAIPPTPAAAVPPVQQPAAAIPPTPQPAAAIPPTQPAMPSAPAPSADAPLTVEDVRAAWRAMSTAAFRIGRAPTWADGTPKPSFMTIEAMPQELYGRFLAELGAMA